MKKTQKINEFFFLIFLIGVMSIFLCGCIAGTQRWREEVQLGDGRIITIEREILFEGGGDEIASNRTGTKPKEYRLRFSHPDKLEQEIDWRSTKFYEGSWPERLLYLNLESGEPVVFTSVGIGPAQAMYSKYVYRDDIWQEEKLLEIFPERTSNLYLKIGIDMPDFVDLERKRKEFSSYRRVSKKIGPKLTVITDY